MFLMMFLEFPVCVFVFNDVPRLSCVFVFSDVPSFLCVFVSVIFIHFCINGSAELNN